MKIRCQNKYSFYSKKKSVVQNFPLFPPKIICVYQRNLRSNHKIFYDFCAFLRPLRNLRVLRVLCETALLWESQKKYTNADSASVLIPFIPLSAGRLL